MVASKPIWMLVTTASHIPAGAQGLVQLSSVNEPNWYRFRDGGLLKLIATTTKIGTNM